MDNSSNQDKVQHGTNNQRGVKDLLAQFQKSGLIQSFVPKYTNGYTAYDANQFYAPFLVTFLDGEEWLIYTSTSYRSDRAKEWYWDILNLKNINRLITRAYFVYSDSLPAHEKALFKKWSQLISSHSLFTKLDGVYAYSAFREKLKQRASSGKNSGFMKNATGVMYEQEVAHALGNKSNLEHLKKPSPSDAVFDYEVLEKVLDKLGIDPVNVVRVDASADLDDIGLLPSGGKPKTDVLADIELDSGDIRTITISCKKTADDWVTVSQFPADTMADAIDSTNGDLRRLLNRFQAEGAVSGLTLDEQNELTGILSSLKRRLAIWALGGVYGSGTPKTQWAKWILISRSDAPDDFSFWAVDDYADHLIKNTKGNFGTPFRWTYASGQKGKSIQLKAKII
jgi:hypothetical protein